MNKLEQNAVGIAMHDPGDRRVRMIADRIGVLARLHLQLRGSRNELPRDRIVGTGFVDQFDQRRRNRNCVARGDTFELG
ncbi:hypothetical protein ACVWWR_007022 [Bradyrhizobium sp. LM3.2]